MLKIIILIGSGSFAGGVLRFLGSRFVQNQINSTFPLGTFSVNILGSLLIGLFYGIAERENLMNNELRVFLTIGFCGGFTTFSTFTHENITLLKEGNFFYFSLYAGLSVFMGLMATYLGNLVTKLG